MIRLLTSTSNSVTTAAKPQGGDKTMITVEKTIETQAQKILSDTKGIQNVFLLDDEIEKRISCFGCGDFSERLRAKVCELLGDTLWG